MRFRTAHKSGWRHEWRQPDRLGFVTARTVAPWPTRDVGAELNTAYTPARLARGAYPCQPLSVKSIEWVSDSDTQYHLSNFQTGHTSSGDHLRLRSSCHEYLMDKL